MTTKNELSRRIVADMLNEQRHYPPRSPSGATIHYR